MRSILQGIDRRDRLNFCKADFDNATRCLRRQKVLWSDVLFKEVVAVTLDYFDISPFQCLPTAVVQDIFLWLPISSFSQVCSVSTEWRQVGHSDEIWTLLYMQKFLQNNPGALPINSLQLSQIDLFQARLRDPQVGDKVEVAWRGKFRMETQDVYQGLAWWVGEIVEKAAAQGRYRIRYPGWESRWDEWVERCRLRWTVQRNTLVAIEVGDIVELWCCGANVPGAWLESKVKKVRAGRFCLGRVLSSGYLWVERDRLRLVRKASEGLDRPDSRPSPMSGASTLSEIVQRLRFAVACAIA